MTGREDGGRRARWQGRREGRAEDPGASVFRSLPSTSSASSCAPELVSCPAGLVTKRMRSARQFAPAEGAPCARGGSLSGSDGRIGGLAGLACLRGPERRCSAMTSVRVAPRLACFTWNIAAGGPRQCGARPGSFRRLVKIEPWPSLMAPLLSLDAPARRRGRDEAAKGCHGPKGDIPASYKAELGPVVGLLTAERPSPLREPGWRSACWLVFHVKHCSRSADAGDVERAVFHVERPQRLAPGPSASGAH